MEYYPPYLDFIKREYNNSAYAKTILIRYLLRQGLEIQPPRLTDQFRLRRTPSVNETRGRIARGAIDEDILSKTPGAYPKYRDCAIAQLEMFRRDLPDIIILSNKPVLRANWKEKLLACRCSLYSPFLMLHATSFIRNNGRWYFADDTWGYAYEIPPKFVNHFLYSIVLGKKIEFNSVQAKGIYLVVDDIVILLIESIVEPEKIRTGVGSYTAGTYYFVGSSPEIASSKDGMRDFVRARKSTFQYFFEKPQPDDVNDNHVLTPEELTALRHRAAAEQFELSESELPSTGYKWSELFEAVKRGDQETAISKIKENVELRPYEGLTKMSVLMLACKMGQTNVVKAILESNQLKFVDNQDSYGNTPFIFACENDEVELVAMLLRYGSDPNKRNKYGVTGLWNAVNNKNVRVALFLINDMEAINLDLGNPMSLIEEGDAEMAPVKAAFLAKGAKADAETIYQYTDDSQGALDRQLVSAIRANNTATAFKLIERGAQATVDSLGTACSSRIEPLVLKLLEKPGVDVNKQWSGSYPLGQAAEWGSVRVVKRLLELGANVNLMNDGKTPLYIACKEWREAAALALIEAGADVNIGNPIAFFRSDRMPSVKAALLAKGAKDPLQPPVHVPATKREKYSVLLSQGLDPKNYPEELLRRNKSRRRKSRKQRKTRRTHRR